MFSAILTRYNALHGPAKPRGRERGRGRQDDDARAVLGPLAEPQAGRGPSNYDHRELTTGEDLPVRLLHNGKLIAGVTIKAFHKGRAKRPKPIVTDSQGPPAPQFR